MPRILAGGALVAAMCGLPAHGQSSGLAAPAAVLRYSAGPDSTERAGVAVDGDAAVLTVQRLQEPGGAPVGEVRNDRLFPARDPLNRAAASAVRLDAEVDGFTAVVEYRFPDGTERFALRFGAAACSAGLARNAPAVRDGMAGSCAWPLRAYRRERLDDQGTLVSGIVVDYSASRARWLDHPVRPLRAPMPTVALRAVPAPTLGAMPSVFDFSPALDVPVRH